MVHSLTILALKVLFLIKFGYQDPIQSTMDKKKFTVTLPVVEMFD